MEDQPNRTQKPTAQFTLRQTWKKIHSRETPSAPRWSRVVGLVLLLLFLFLGSQVYYQADWTIALNDAAAGAIQSLRTEELSGFLYWFCMGPDASIMYVTASVLALLLIACALKKEWIEFIFIVENAAVMMLLVIGLKKVYDIARPLHQMIIDVPMGASFPSGHTGSLVMLTFIVGAVAVLYFYERGKVRTGWIIFGVLFVYSVIMSASRIYFGVHWATDIIGAWLIVSAFGVPSITWFLTKDKYLLEQRWAASENAQSE